MNRKVALQIINTMPVEEVAKAMAQSGFKYAAMAFDDGQLLISDDWEKYVYETGNLLSKYGLKCIQTHAPAYSLLLSAENRDENMELALMRSIEATKMLGAEICAVHPRSFIKSGEPRETAVDREKSLRENIVSMSPLVDLCEKHNVFLGIENLMKYPHAHPYFYSWLAEDHCDLIDSLKSDKAAAIWDFGHANLADAAHAERIRTLGSRIKGTHVHNNGAREDHHLPPILLPSSAYYVDRSVEWKSVLPALRSTGYDGYLTLETVINFDYPIGAYIQYLYDSISVLDSIMYEEE